MEKNTITRHQLYELVWSEPLSALSKMYCITENGMRKVCKNMNIPMPQVGYLQKVEHGKPVHKTTLLEEFKGNDEIQLKIRDKDCNDSTSTNSAHRALTIEITKTQGLLLKVQL